MTRLRGDLLSPDWRRVLLEFVPAAERYDGYGLGVAKGQVGTEEVWFDDGAGPEFVTGVSHLPAKEITVAVLSSGDVDLRLLTRLLTDIPEQRRARHGYAKCRRLYRRHGRISQVRVVTDRGSRLSALRDERADFLAAELRTGRTDFVRLVIDGVFGGERYEGTLISEVRFRLEPRR